MISKILLIVCSCLILFSTAYARELNEYKVANLAHASNEELKALIDKQNEIIAKQNLVIEKLDKNYAAFKKEVDEHKVGQQYMNYPLWTSILLGSATFVITALGVVGAFASIFGYQKIKQSALEIASKEAKMTASTTATESVSKELPQLAIQEITRLIDEGKFNKTLEDAVDMIWRTQKYQSSSTFSKYPELDEE